jgi:hypothetical protein
MKNTFCAHFRVTANPVVVSLYFDMPYRRQVYVEKNNLLCFLSNRAILQQSLQLSSVAWLPVDDIEVKSFYAYRQSTNQRKTEIIPDCFGDFGITTTNALNDPNRSRAIFLRSALSSVVDCSFIACSLMIAIVAPPAVIPST